MSSLPTTPIDPDALGGGALDGDLLANDVVARLLADGQVGIWRFDPDTDLYHFSAELELGYGGTSKETPRDQLKSIQHPADRAKDDEIRERITTEGGEAETEMRYRRIDGAWIHLRVHYRSGRRLASGRFEMYGLSQDITPQAEARDAAASAMRKAALAMSAANAGLFEYDYRKQSYAASDELISLLRAAGVARTDDAMTIFHPHDRKKVRLFGRAALSAGAPPIDVRVTGSLGSRWMRLSMDVERDHKGEPLRGVGLMLDIDDQKRQALDLEKARKAAEAATEAKSTFLASVSHEIRTPLNGVTGILHLLKREPLSDEARGMLNQALASGEMLAQLINDILDFSKIEAGKLELSPVATDVAAAVEGVASMLRPIAEAKGLCLTVSMRDAPDWAMIDPVRLRQCLFNITGNAVKFTKDGGVEIRLNAMGEGAAQRLRFEIEDTGIGIPEEARGRLFERFQQAESGTTRKFGGTGLGLAISRSLSRMMGGDMGFDSVLGQGSTFWFEIAAPACAVEKAEADLSGMDAPLEGLCFLVVDDNATNRLVAGKTLEAMGAQAVCVDGGAEAIEAVRTGAYDLILMDINMPDMDGMEATRRIRALGGDAAAVPVIALTADVMAHQRERYFAAGMNGVAPKPFSPGQLLSEIARLMAEPDDGAEVSAA